MLSSIEKVKDELPSEEDDDETDLVKKDNVEGVQRELNDNEEKISQSDTKSVCQN